MFNKVITIADLAHFLSVDKSALLELNPANHYLTFEIPKPGSEEKRTIETPTGPLRMILDRVSDNLQWLYLDFLTDAAYGFVRSLKYSRVKRNIYTNAKRHLGRKYMLNIDLDDFFYQVDIRKVKSIFSDFHHFSFDDNTEALLSDLVTYKGRLPMGSPTSPPMSNFATIGLDNELLSWASRSSFVYTRYVDDLSFSSNMQISRTHFSQIMEIIQSHAFKIDEKKTHWFGKDEVKEVTGLLLGDKITVPDQFITDLEREITNLREIIRYSRLYPDAYVFEWIDKVKQGIGGKFAFLGMIYGKSSPVYSKLLSRFKTVDSPETELYSISWRYAGYNFH
jgi:RNA-directed DNA polymerase